VERSVILERMKRQRQRRRKTVRILKKVTGWALVVFFVSTILSVLVLRWYAPPTTAYMLQSCLSAWKDGRDNYRVRYQWIPWEDISSQTKLAVIAAEDQKFPTHGGFDFESISDAWHERVNGIRQRGASTITQQVAKNIFLWPRKSFLRKGLEAYFTVLIEMFWSKKRILEVYLNIVEFGDGIYGVSAAGKIFFKKPATRLSLRNSAVLAAVLPNPSRFKANRPSAYVRKRSTWILNQMRLLGGTAYLKNL